MSYIGNTPISVAFLTDTFSGNGSTTAFTMTVAPANTSSILVAVTGVVQDPSTYSVAGTTLTFSGAPPSGTSNISVRYLGIPASGVTTTAYRTVTDTTATASQTSFTIPSYTVGYVDVFRNGVRLAAADFTATTGTTVVLANACTVGDTVTTVSFYVSSVLNAIPATAGSVSDTYIVGMSASKLTGTQTIPKATLPTGSVLQVVQTVKTDVFTTSSTSFVDVTGFSASITPTSATNKILVIASCYASPSLANYAILGKLVRGSTDIAIGDARGSSTRVTFSTSASSTNWSSFFGVTFLDSPATTSSTTYKVQVAAESGSTLLVGGSYTSVASYNGSSPISLTLMEIVA